MKKSRFTEEQMVSALQEAEAGANVKELCRRLGISRETLYNWKRKYGGMNVPDAKRLKQLEDENRQLKRIVADQALNVQVLKDLLGKQVVTARARRQVVTKVQAALQVSERCAVRFTGFSRSSMRYESTRDPQEALCERIQHWAARKPRWGYRFIHRMLRREGWCVNRKRVQRLYREAGLAVRRRGKRKRMQMPRVVRNELTGVNQRWSMDFVRDTLSNGRAFRCLNIIDEYSRECLAIEVSHSLPSVRVIEVLERLRITRGLPAVIITDNGSEFTSRAFDGWAYARDVRLDYIEPGKPVQNCFVESFNGTFRDDCLNAHWFVSLDRARVTIETWRKEYNEERPHSSLNDLTPAEYAEFVRPGDADRIATTSPSVRS